MALQVLLEKCIQLLSLIWGHRVDLCTEGLHTRGKLNSMVPSLSRGKLIKVLLWYICILFDVKKYLIYFCLCQEQRRVYACVCRWGACIRPCGMWLSKEIDVRLQQVSVVYMTVSVSIPGRCMRIEGVRFWCSMWWLIVTVSWGRNGTIPVVTELLLLSNKLSEAAGETDFL